MECHHDELNLERRHLSKILEIIRARLKEDEKRNQDTKEKLVTARQEMWENAARSSNDLDRIIDLSQHFQEMTNQTFLFEAEEKNVHALRGLRETPYFARIDFCQTGNSQARKVYIGRAMLMDEGTYEVHVYDWRTPIASLFYRYGVGEASYEAPSGTISGEISLKRQFEIKHGELLYFFDADVQIIDEYLRQLLAQNASPQMKTIVETIQRDQDMVIRDDANELLMVQGVAGSGKTSIALHRVAYLMYEGLSSRLSAHNIVILSPNTLFERYISGVLPELGEQNVTSFVFEDLMRQVLPANITNFQTRSERLEHLLTHRENSSRGGARFKMSAVFVEILRRYVRELPRRWPYADVYYDGRVVSDRENLKAQVLHMKKGLPFAQHLRKLERDTLVPIHKLRKARLEKLERFAARYPEHVFETREFARMLSIRESAVMIQGIRKFARIDTPVLYRELFADLQTFSHFAKGLALPEDIAGILAETSARLAANEWAYEDAVALAFLHLCLHGYEAFRGIRQVVVDEAQDYDPLHYEIVNLLFPNARYTILGDMRQTIEKQEDITLYDGIRRVLGKEKSTLVSMSKSFRCTSEILTFGAQFIEDGAQIESFSRHGEVPCVHAAASVQEMDDLIVKEAEACLAKGFLSVGVLVPSRRDALALHARMGERLSARCVGEEDAAALRGVLILPIYMAKGLEFDAVLLPDVDKAHYFTPEDRQLLYIACTRALHHLQLFHTGEVSPWLAERGNA